MPRRPQLQPVHALGESKDGPWRVWVSAKQSETGSKYRRYFPTKAAAEQFAKNTRARLSEVSEAARNMTGEQRHEAYRCLLICQEHGFTLTAAVELMRERAIQTKRSILLPVLVADFLAYKQGRGLSHDYLKDARVVLNRFADAYPQTLASDLSADLIRAYLDGQTGFASPVSWNNHRRLISVLLNYARRHLPPYVAANVCADIEEKPVPDKEVEIYTVDDSRRLLEAAAAYDRRLVPILAIALFAGVRPDESRRLDWSEVLWPEGDQPGHVEIKAAKSKTAQRRLIEIQPVLLAWLEPFRAQGGRIWPLGRHAYYEMMPLLREKAGVRQVDDGFRHTFASHHLAKFNDLGRTTADLGHRTTAMLFEHYRRVVKKADADAFFNLFPKTP